MDTETVSKMQKKTLKARVETARKRWIAARNAETAASYLTRRLANEYDALKIVWLNQ